MPKTVTKRTPRIKVGKGLLIKWKKYPFDDLKIPGNYFIVQGMKLENSIRAQASKNQSKRGVKYQVRRVHAGEQLEDGTKIIRDGLVVRFDSYNPT